MSQIPFLLVSDNVTSPTGLARISRELAVRIHENLSDTFRLGTLGYGGSTSRHFKWQQYNIPRLENWSIPDLPKIWSDFAGDEKGILFTIFNPSWLPWLADPTKLPQGTLKDFLMSDPFQTWGYFPVDAEGPNGLLPKEVEDVISEFDRPLMYTSWASALVRKTSGRIIPHLPHGTDTKIFYPRDRREARKTFIETVTGNPKMSERVHEKIFLVGITATNTARKDWDLGFQVCQELRNRGVNVVLWAHIDSLKKHWNLPALAAAYGMKDRVVFTDTDLTDEQLAEALCACNVTLGIGLGEGWGLPMAESLACAVPVVTGDYAGATEFVPEGLRVKPVGFYADGWYGHRRPVFNAADWANRILKVLLSHKQGAIMLSPEFTWDGCWPAWEKWLLEGVNGTQEEKISLSTIRELNYDHHRRMTIDHEKGGQTAAVQIKSKDDDSYRALLSNIPHGGKILELGSAWGGQWNALREWSEDLTGIDLYEPAVTKSQEEGKNIYLGFVEKIPFPDESFDLVCSRHVMEHVSDIQVALAEIKRVLKPGGYVAAVTPHRFPDLEPAHIQQLRIDAWVLEYGKAGFDVLSSDIREYECVEAHIVARKTE